MVICELANGAEPFAGICTTLMLTEKVRGYTPQLLDCTTVPREENNDQDGKVYVLKFENKAVNSLLFAVTYGTLVQAK